MDKDVISYRNLDFDLDQVFSKESKDRSIFIRDSIRFVIVYVIY